MQQNNTLADGAGIWRWSGLRPSGAALPFLDLLPPFRRLSTAFSLHFRRLSLTFHCLFAGIPRFCTAVSPPFLGISGCRRRRAAWPGKIARKGRLSHPNNSAFVIFKNCRSMRRRIKANPAWAKKARITWSTMRAAKRWHSKRAAGTPTRVDETLPDGEQEHECLLEARDHAELHASV